MGLSIDREKVIKALECRKNADKRCGNPCEESGMCYYATAIRGLDGDIYKPFICDRERICADALVLLKEQEAMSPEEFKNGLLNMFSSIWDSEIDHPVFQDTVGDLMSGVIQLYKEAVKLE